MSAFVRSWQSQRTKEESVCRAPVGRIVNDRNQYTRRMWIEGMFSDFKGRGLDLESTRLRRFGKLSRLTLAVAMLYVWLVVYGAWTERTGGIIACFGWATICWRDVWPKGSGRSSAYFRALCQNCPVASLVIIG